MNEKLETFLKTVVESELYKTQKQSMLKILPPLKDVNNFNESQNGMSKPVRK